jgi:iron(III) transport system substrate-binding protein
MVGEAVLGIGWNTNLYPKKITDLPSVLDASLKGGKLGVVQPTAPSLVDWYLWVESRYGGKAFLQKLAAQKPKIYTSSLPMTQAVAAGEISVGSFVATSAIDLKQQGAPINFMVPGGTHAWNAPWWGLILKKAPHPAAAQLLMDYLVTKQGQATSEQHLGVVLKGIPGTYYVHPRPQNLAALTPSKVTAFENYWTSLFK